jgi:hypothetical protein
MTDELRLKHAKEHPKDWEPAEITVKGALMKLGIAVQILHALRQNLDTVDGRGLSIAITHVETAILWVADSTKVEEPLED